MYVAQKAPDNSYHSGMLVGKAKSPNFWREAVCKSCFYLKSFDFYNFKIKNTLSGPNEHVREPDLGEVGVGYGIILWHLLWRINFMSVGTMLYFFL